MTIDYGSDTSCTDELRPGRVVRGPELVAEACYRRISTRRGEIIDDPDYGIDLSDLVQKGLTPGMLAMVPTVVKAQLAKDPRVSAVSVRARVVGAGLVVEIEGECGAGPFALAVTADKLTVEMMRP